MPNQSNLHRRNDKQQDAKLKADKSSKVNLSDKNTASAAGTVPKYNSRTTDHTSRASLKTNKHSLMPKAKAEPAFDES